MLKLTRQLFFTDPAQARTTSTTTRRRSTTTSSASQDPNSAHGFQCYYVPLRAGGIKTYSNDYDSFVCCHGTGMESSTKFGDSIYFHDGASTLFVNLFIPSVLTWSARGVTIRQETGFPEAASTKLTVTGVGHVHHEGAHPVVGHRQRRSASTAPSSSSIRRPARSPRSAAPGRPATSST